MPSFDIVSKPDLPSVNNAIDGVKREISTRYDFKGSQSKVEICENLITITELKRKQVEELLNTHVTRQKVDSKFLGYGKIEVASGNMIRQAIEVKTGIAREDSQKIIKLVKSMKNKVQIQIQGDELRVSGKKRDELQSIIAFIKDKFDYIPLQYINFRD